MHAQFQRRSHKFGSSLLHLFPKSAVLLFQQLAKTDETTRFVPTKNNGLRSLSPSWEKQVSKTDTISANPNLAEIFWKHERGGEGEGAGGSRWPLGSDCSPDRLLPLHPAKLCRAHFFSLQTGIRGRWRRAWRPAAISGHATGMHGVDYDGH
jgi:hypothetical protein